MLNSNSDESCIYRPGQSIQTNTEKIRVEEAENSRNSENKKITEGKLSIQNVEKICSPKVQVDIRKLMLKDEETLKKSGKKTPMKTKKIRKLKPKTEEKINLSFETTELGKMFKYVKIHCKLKLEVEKKIEN